MDRTSLFLVLMMTNWTKDNMLNTYHLLQKRRVIHPFEVSQYGKVLTHHFHQRLQRRMLTQRKEEFYGRKRIFTNQILHGCTTHPVTASNYSSPCALLAKYFSHDIFALLGEETNRRYFIKEGRQLKVTPTEMQKCTGICILMGNLNYPRLRMYWQTSYR